jgi:hypothetical protein
VREINSNIIFIHIIAVNLYYDDWRTVENVSVTLILQFGSAVIVVQGASDKFKHNFYTYHSC